MRKRPKMAKHWKKREVGSKEKLPLAKRSLNKTNAQSFFLLFLPIQNSNISLLGLHVYQSVKNQTPSHTSPKKSFTYLIWWGARTHWYYYEWCSSTAYPWTGAGTPEWRPWHPEPPLAYGLRTTRTGGLAPQIAAGWSSGRLAHPAHLGLPRSRSRGDPCSWNKKNIKNY